MLTSLRVQPSKYVDNFPQFVVGLLDSAMIRKLWGASQYLYKWSSFVKSSQKSLYEEHTTLKWYTTIIKICTHTKQNDIDKGKKILSLRQLIFSSGT